MFNAAIISQKTREYPSLYAKIKQSCPLLEVSGMASNQEEYKALFKDDSHDIFFINPDALFPEDFYFIKSLASRNAYIFVTNSLQHVELATYLRAIGYLVDPIKSQALIDAVDAAKEVLNNHYEKKNIALLLQQLLRNNKNENRLIGIPTVDGFEVLLADHIIKCEGLQKCTRIVTIHRKDIISSYSIGQFKKLLEKYDWFFSPHRSYLINVLFVERFKKSGTIILKDGDNIPIAKNKKVEFLNILTHL